MGWFIIQPLNIGNRMATITDHNRDLILLEEIEKDPNATQATLAVQMGVAVGTINWHLKRLIAKGYVKARRAQRKKLRYLITSEGLALMARLTIDYIQSQFQLYRLVRVRMMEALGEVKAGGYTQIQLIAEGDVAEVCKLTCLEQGVTINNSTDQPMLRQVGYKMQIEWPNGGSEPVGANAEELNER
jgi:DNA-binding MarR family transcriptional regulator